MISRCGNCNCAIPLLNNNSILHHFSRVQSESNAGNCAESVVHITGAGKRNPVPLCGSSGGMNREL